jgi:hypothetical protein
MGGAGMWPQTDESRSPREESDRLCDLVFAQEVFGGGGTDANSADSG